MYADKPIIGIVGGIGSGKSFVAKIFAEFGCLVISSDDQVRDAYEDPRVKQTLRDWWGDGIFLPDRQIDRRAIAERVFNNPAERKRLEQLLHPMVHEARRRLMEAHADDAQVTAFVWDTPLLVEVGLHRQCDALVFVDAPLSVRLARVQQTRGWEPSDLESREKLQMPLDRKKEISDYVVSNTAGADEVRAQVRDVLSRILAGLNPSTSP